MPFLQLKPAEQLFLKMARDLMRLDALVLCEGTRDAELFKLVAGEPGMRLGVTDCGGIREVYEVGRYVADLARLSRRLKSLARAVLSHGGTEAFLSLPPGKLREILLSLPGIGPETADSILLYALGRPVFVVDAYTRRLLDRLGIGAPRGYEPLREYFESQLPRSPRLFMEYHALIVAQDGSWVAVQQGMCPSDRTARRYHWFSGGLREGFVVEPHTGIIGDAVRRLVLDMTARESEGCRKASVDLAKEGPSRVRKLLRSLRPEWQKSLSEWLPGLRDTGLSVELKYLRMPMNLNWKALARAYELQPSGYEQLLAIRGIGPATVRALALIADLIYGEEPSWRDPARFSFAFGGKDGVPYPVNRELMDEAISILEEAVRKARLGQDEKVRALRRLRGLIPARP
mgnify:CR=1 FL=1